MASLNIKDLQREVAFRQQRNNEVYEKILALVHKKIIATNEKSDDYHCIYKLPNFMYGYPIYDSKKCMEYLLTKLSHNGFDVQYIDGNNIYISWRPKVPIVVPQLPSSAPAIQYNPLNFQPYPQLTTSKKSDKFNVDENYSTYSMQFPGSQMIENNIRSITTPAKKDNKMDIKFVDMNTYQPGNEIPF